MIEITLNEVEHRLAVHVAKQRTAFNRANRIKDLQVSKIPHEQMEADGVGAEIAFCKLFNLYPDFATMGANRDDATLHDGRGVDVKQTRHETGRLLAMPHKTAGKQCDLYALMIGSLPTYRFAGLVHKDAIFKEENMMDLGCGPAYALPQSELSTDDWLKAYNG